MKKDKVHIPSRKKSMVETEQVVKVSPEAYNALVEIYNESSCSMKQIASLLIIASAERVVYDRED